MNKQIVVAVFLLFSSLFSTAAYSHESFRTIGVIENLILKEEEVNYIQVRNQNDQSVQLWISGATEISKDDQAIEKSELEVGNTVVVDSYGDGYNYSEALTVRIVPAIP
jgi:hypothetical protein